MSPLQNVRRDDAEPTVGGTWTALVVAALVVAAVVPAGVGAAGSTDATTDTSQDAALVDGHPPDPGADPSGAPPNGSGPAHPKVADGVLDSGGDATSVATEDVVATEKGEIDVVVETAPGAARRVAAAVRAHGRVGVVHGDLVEATLSRAAIRRIANRSDVEFVRRPYRLRAPGWPPDPSDATVTGTSDATRIRTDDATVRARTTSTETSDPPGSITSEGVAAMGADAAQDAGYTGEGTTVVVVDTGFDPADPEIADAIARTKDFTGDGIDGGRTAHGTATAQIVADVAPDARLVLVSVRNYAQMLAAVDWIDDETDADVVSMSLGLPGGVPIDGSAELDEEIAESAESGTAWMVSAGNEANGGHWNGTWRDGDGDGWLNFTGDDETLTVAAPMSLTVQWPDWPDSRENYDLFLFDDDGEVVASSESVQSGTQPPVEQLNVRESGTYQLGIKRVDASGDAEFDMFYTGLSALGPRPEYWTATRSLVVPATGPRTTAIGAADVGTLEVEPFSSRGPTIDGRRKPAFLGPDRVTTSTYRSFPGTSAAAPHAAGAAALVVDGDPSLSPAEVVDRLAATADDRGYGDLPNNRAGDGFLDVDDAVGPPDPAATEILTDPITAGNADAVRVAVRFPAPPAASDVVVQLRDEAGETVTGRAAADTDDRTTVVTVDASDLSDGPVTARSKVVDGLDNENPAGFTARSPSVEYGGAASVGFDRTLSRSSAPANATATVTTRVRVTEPTDRLALVAEFEPAFESVRVLNARIDGEGRIRFADVDADSLTYAIEGLEANASVAIEYEVRLPEDAEIGDESRIAGRVTAGETDLRLVDVIDVEAGVAAYADADGIVREDGLRDAIADWGAGDLSDAGLRRVIVAWSSGEPVE